MTPETRSQFAAELAANLRENILPYWLDNMTDPEGGFYGRRDGHDVLHPEAPRGAILNARILWSFSAAYGATGNSRWLEAARRARDYVIDRFVDKEYGGVYWSINPDGSPADTRKQFYAIAFTIYGLAEYARRCDSADSTALNTAITLFKTIERYSRDRIHDGYIEAATRDWKPLDDMRLSEKDENLSKTMNTHLHILEAYTALLRVWRTPECEEATRYVLKVMSERIFDSRTGHLGLFYDDMWHRCDGEKSYGHDIEASWLMLEAAQEIGDDRLYADTLALTRRLASAAMRGLCADGSMVYERHANGTYDNEKHWWVQAETVVGQAWLAACHGVGTAWDGAWKTWCYIRDNLVDINQGEWFWSRLPDGTVNRAEDKAGFWKCPYHNTRMCLETLRLLSQEP